MHELKQGTMVAVEREDDNEISIGRLGDYLGFRFRRLQNQLSRDFSAETRDQNLRAGMFSALEIINANRGISQMELAAEVGLDKSAIVPLVDDLEARGWVARTKSKRDRRRNELSVTKAGQVELDKLFAALDRVEEAVHAILTDAERTVMNDALDKMYHAYIRGAGGVER
jgi:DNA-binding MarR family transcriptional regulator